MLAEVRIMRPLELVSHSIAAAGIARIPAITRELVGAKKLWVGMTILEPGASTEPHHHGDSETGVYVVAGRLRLRWGMRLDAEAELAAGDLLFVPPYLPHVEINPSEDESAVCVVLCGGRQVHIPVEPDNEGEYRLAATD